MMLIVLAGCANVEDRRDPQPGNRYAVTLASYNVREARDDRKGSIATKRLP